MEVRTEQQNTLVVLLDDYAAEVSLNGGDAWQGVSLQPHDFVNLDGESLAKFNDVMRLKLGFSERLKPPRGSKKSAQIVGEPWKGAAPRFRSLRWIAP